jgi:hypothetical protein
VHDAIGLRRQRRQCRRRFEHAFGERLDDVEVPVRAMLDERLAQRAQVPRRVVHAEALVAELVVEVAHGAMELRDDAPGRARLLGAAERVMANAVDARQHAPDAVVLEPQRAVACRHEPRRHESLAAEVLGDGRNVDVHFGRENRIHALQDERRAAA